MLLSGRLDAFHLALGVISTLIVTLWTGDLFFKDHSKSFGSRIRESFEMIRYSFWLFYEIILANFHVVYIAFHPRMLDLINPKIVRFKTTLKKEVPLFFLANSITLTPGTVTVRIKEDEFLVHALTNKVAEECPGDMETKIKRIFGDSA